MAARHSDPQIIPETAATVARAKARGMALKLSPSSLIGATYRASADVFDFTLRGGTHLVIPRSNIGVETIARANATRLRRIEIGAFGTYAWFPDLDEGVNPVGMLARQFGQTLQAEPGHAGGGQNVCEESRGTTERQQKRTL